MVRAFLFFQEVVLDGQVDALCDLEFGEGDFLLVAGVSEEGALLNSGGRREVDADGLVVLFLHLLLH